MDKERSKLCGERLKEVIKENGYTQARFADEILIGMNPKYLSLIIRGDRQLTDEQAKRTVEKFPYINFAWLKGVSDIKTVRENKNMILGRSMKESFDRFNIIESLIRSYDYDVNVLNAPESKTVTELRSPEGQTCYLSNDEYYSIIKSVQDCIQGQLLLAFNRARQEQEVL